MDIIEAQVRVIEERYEMLAKQRKDREFGFRHQINLTPGTKTVLEEKGWHCINESGNTYYFDCCYGVDSPDPEEQFLDILTHAVRVAKREFEYQIPQLSEEAKRQLNDVGLEITPHPNRKMRYFFKWRKW